MCTSKKLSLQYCPKLSCNYNNPAYTAVFNSKFHSVFERKPTQLAPIAIRVSGDLQMVGFKKSDVTTSSIPATPPWLLARPVVHRDNTKCVRLPDTASIFRAELCHFACYRCGPTLKRKEFCNLFKFLVKSAVYQRF